MENIKSYESFSSREIKESDSMYECGMSDNAKMALESLCESMLCKEAEDYHNDENPDHTYEGYVKECMDYMREAMGHPGYASLNPIR